jgi:hypothetical protein
VKAKAYLKAVFESTIATIKITEEGILASSPERFLAIRRLSANTKRDQSILVQIIDKTHYRWTNLLPGNYERR